MLYSGATFQLDTVMPNAGTYSASSNPPALLAYSTPLCHRRLAAALPLYNLVVHPYLLVAAAFSGLAVVAPGTHHHLLRHPS